MALSKELKEIILSDYHTGKFSQRELAQKHSVGIGTINRLTKGLKAKNGTLVDEYVDTTIKQNEIMEQIGTLSKTERNSVQKVAQDEIRRKNLVYGNAEKFLSKMNSLSDSVEDAQELKYLVDANHKAGQTLGVVEQFAPKTVIENTNAQQTNEVKRVTIVRRDD